MKDWHKVVVKPEDKILSAMKIIDQGSLQIALVVDELFRLIGTVTDGNIRRGIIKGIQLDEPVNLIMNNNPIHIIDSASHEQALVLMREKQLHHIPRVNGEGKLTGLFTVDELIATRYYDNPVVLMAGGLGTRLRPLTNIQPKPLLNIGDKPILEYALENFLNQGFKNFFITVNYKAEMIEDYFGDGSKWAANIEYVKEKQRLGTAGALSLLAFENDDPIIIMNGDILTKIDFTHLLNFHNDTNASATMCVREYLVEIPYGVVEIENDYLIGIREKPVQRFFTNAGIYVLNTDVLSLIPEDSYYDMTDLFNQLIVRKQKTGAFPLREYWIDIGRMDDYEKANGEYQEVSK